MMANSVCVIPGCIRDVKHPKTNTCSACYSSMYAASRRTIKQNLTRLQNLEIYRARTSIMTGSVSNIPKRQPLAMSVLPGQGGAKFKIKKKKLHVA